MTISPLKSKCKRGERFSTGKIGLSSFMRETDVTSTRPTFLEETVSVKKNDVFYIHMYIIRGQI